VAIRVWPVGPARKKNAGRARVVSPQARISLQSARAGPQAHIKKKLALSIMYFLMC